MAAARPERDDPPVGRSRRGARVVAPVLVVLALVAVVAVASRGSTSGGTDRSTTPSDAALDTVFTLLLVAFVVGLALVVYAAFQRRELTWSTPHRRNDLRAIAALLAFGFALALYIRMRGWNLTFNPAQTPLDRGDSAPLPPGLGTGGEPDYRFQLAWLPAVVALGLVAVAVAAFVLSARRRRIEPFAVSLAADLTFALDLSLDDLRAETDPRRAVIAAYARLERVLAAHGEPRRPSDTPAEHVSRALSQLEVDPRGIARLADLFEWAKFSQHEVDAGMKQDAIAALEQVRDELAAAGGEAAPRPTAAEALA